MEKKENKNCNSESRFEVEDYLVKEDLEVTKITIFDAEDMSYMRAYLTDGTKSKYAVSTLKFIVVGWRPANEDDFDDVGFFYKSPHMRKWEFVPVVNWMRKYKNAFDFLKEYPDFLELFDDKDIHPVIWKVTKLLLQKKKFRIVVEDSQEQD